MAKQRSNKGRKAAAPKPRSKAALQSATKATTAPLEEPEIQSASESLPEFAIAGIGASAGGLEALRQLLGALPSRPAMAFVVVQHLAPKHESLLASLLADTTSLPVTEVTDNVVVERDHVYVIPPNREMGISAGRLRLMPRPDARTQFNPIDYFLRSLADYAQARAIGIILSGTASDGAIGMREIKGNAGITIVQEPKTAKYDGMPRAAIATGVVDLVLSPQDIARELPRIGRQLVTTAPAPLADALGRATPVEGPPPPQLGRIFTMLRKACGVDFTHYKLPTIRRRLHRRMVLHKMTNLDKYVQFLETHPNEITSLYQDLLIHVTRFFRDPESFEAINKAILPAICGARQEGCAIRVWVPGCSTGEEAYSMAIAIVEYLGDNASTTTIQVFATDVSEAAIEHARAGIYPESISADVSPDRLRRFFTRIDGSYRTNKSIRDLCIFARQDVTRDPPFSRLDLIVCRNVLIYLDSAIQKRLMGVFHYALQPRGYLMLGGAETVGTSADLFSVVDKRHRIYSKREASVLPARTELYFTGGSQPPIGGISRGAVPETVVRSARNVQHEADRVIFSKFSPPGVIVDSDLRIVQFRGQTGTYLEPAPGEASLSLLKMAREGLLYGLRTALHEARKKETPVHKKGLHVKAGGRIHEVDLEVIPLSPDEGRHFLILFQEPRAAVQIEEPAASPKKTTKTPKGKAGKIPSDRESQLKLQQELAASRQYLQSIIQDLEAANEELQSANEEILSSNEELQSTNEELDTAKEELQSTNEELNTVNEELQGRNEELSRANSDLVNLLASVQIAIVMVTGDLRIRRFTPMAERILNLIPTDVGRPISDIKPNIDCPDLERLITESVDSMTIKELQVKDRRNKLYQLRIRPYKNVENRIDGAVLALFETNTNDGSADGSVEPESIGALFDAVTEPALLLDAQHVVRSANAAFLKKLKMQNILGKSVFDLGNGEWDHDALRRLLGQPEDEGDLGETVMMFRSDNEPQPQKMTVRGRRKAIQKNPVALLVFDVPKSDGIA